MYQEYPSVLPLSNQSTGDLPPTRAPYPKHPEAYDYENSFNYQPPPPARHDTGDSNYGRSGIQYEDISPAYTPGNNPASAPADGYFMAPHVPHRYHASTSFSTAMPMHEGGPPFYGSYYPENSLQAAPSAGPANWQMGGQGQPAVVNPAEQWDPSGPPSWPQP